MSNLRNPPVHEIAATVSFCPPIFALNSEHIGLFWSRIRDRYPKVGQLQTAEDDVLLKVVGSDSPAMPRYCFTSCDDSTVLQVQKNAIQLQCRRQQSGIPSYSRHLKPEIDMCYSTFCEFLQQDVGVEEPTISMCELSYVNLVQQDEHWSGPLDTSAVIPSFLFPSRLTNSSEGIYSDYSFGYELDSDLHLQISIRLSNLVDKPDVPVLAFEIKAGGQTLAVTKECADSWFDRAHQAVVHQFIELTSKDFRESAWNSMEDTP